MIYDTLILNHLESSVEANFISKDRGLLVLYLQLQKWYTRLTDAESSRNQVRFPISMQCRIRVQTFSE